MYYKLRTSIKELGMQGWSYNMDETTKGVKRTYLSKFDERDRRNNDEYKIYFEIENGVVSVVDAIVVKGYKSIISLSPKNEQLLDSTLILEEFADKNGFHFKINTSAVS